MKSESAATHQTIRVEDYNDKLLILAEGDISVHVNRHQDTHPMWARWARWWPAVTGTSVILAMLASTGTLFATFQMQAAVTARLDAQGRDMQDHVDAALAASRRRSDQQVGTLLTKANTIDTKIDLIPSRIDTAARTVTDAMSDQFLTVKRALDTYAPPVRPPPVLVIGRRRTEMLRR